MATKDQLIAWFASGLAATGEKFEALVTSLKGLQSPVSSPSANGNATAFIDSISQDAEGKVTATKKNVNFSGYQTVVGMANYQQLDLQQVGEVTVNAEESQTINHNMKHYPTVRLVDAETMIEIEPSKYTVQHTSNEALVLTLGAELDGSYKYILD